MEVRFEGLSKQYRGKYALKDFTATMREGVYGLLGSNGAGKTTLLNLLMGILRADGGEIYIDGGNVRRKGVDFLKEIGYLPQYPRFYRDFTVEEFLQYMCAVKDIPKQKGLQKMEELLKAVNLMDARTKKIGQLSGGMRQRLGIAQAMLNDPKILILDEPTAGLDPQERIRFRNLISQFSEGRLVILATHIVSDVEFIANRIILLKEGKLVCLGSPAELEESLEGKIWEAHIEGETVPAELLKYRISNMIREENGVGLRLIANEEPWPGAITRHANLEEVFLYYGGEGAGEE